LGVVGSRQSDNFCQETIENYFEYIKNQAELIIASGFAMGVDSIACKTALEKNIPQIVFLGSGIDPKVVYPNSNKDLIEKIISQGGLVVSGFSTTQESSKYTFPLRNKLLISYVDKLWIVKCSLNSGTYLTGSICLLEQKKLFVSVNQNNQEYWGGYELVNKGGSLLYSPSQFYDDQNPTETLDESFLNKQPKEKTQGKNKSKTGVENKNKNWYEIKQKQLLESEYLNKFEKQSTEYKILELLQNQPLEIDQIKKTLDIELSELNSILSYLEFEDILVNQGGNLWGLKI